jgi:hypothetical protein
MAEHGSEAPSLSRQGLYPCEAEIARRLSQSEKHWRRIAPQLERQGLPKIEAMKDETATPSRIIADCVQSQYRYLADPCDVDPRDFGYRVA